MPYDIIIGRDEADKKRFGKRGLVFLGKGFVKMGNYTSLSNRIYLDVARSHVILVAGKRGSGKCLSGDTLINLSDGTQVPIQDLENNTNNVLSLNNQFKIRETSKSEFFSREVDKMLKIRLRSGKEIKLTPEHPLLTIKGWVPAQDLKLGGRIATPRKAVFGKGEMLEHEIKLLAYLIAEGHIANSYCLFSNMDDKIYNDFCESVKQFDTNLKVVEWPKGRKGCYGVTQINKIYEKIDSERDEKGHSLNGVVKYRKTSIVSWLEELKIYNKLAPQKVIPEAIFKLKQNNLSLFLNRLFSCDGSIYSHKAGKSKVWEISYCSSSEKMIRQVQDLLLKFGILSRIREKHINLNNKNFKSYEIVINSENALRFIEEIGFFGVKQEREFIAKQEILSKVRNTNVDTIPKGIWDTFKPVNWSEIGRAMGYKYPKAMRESMDYSPSRQKLLKISEIEHNNPLYLLATSDIFWDEIVSMEILEGNFKVYDICVPENHNFVANDIIVHNSYTLGTIAEELSNLPIEEKQNIAPLIFDTMGIFWTMKYKNDKEKELLKEWGLKPEKLDCRVFVPSGYYDDFEKRGIPVDEKFSIKPSELDIEDWILTFNLDMISPVAVLIERALLKLKQDEDDFSINDIINEIYKEKGDENAKSAAVSLFEAAESWKIFAGKGEKGVDIDELISAGKTTILDLSPYSSIGSFNVRALVIGLISKKLFRHRMMARKTEEVQAVKHGEDYLRFQEKREMPLVWLFIDEAHEFIGKEKTAATDALIQLLREGRQPGISLVMATQQPGQLAYDAMTQSDIVLSHRVTAKPDIDALNWIMQTYLLDSIKKYIDDLPSLKGSAIILDDNSERIYPMRVKPRYTWHGGEAPTSIKIEKRD